MHNAAFRALKLPWVYLAFAVDAARVGEAVGAVRALGLVGINVTIPHKEAVIPHLDALSARARAGGAVNTIVHRRGVLRGENTDVIGLERDWADLGVARRHRDAVVLGAGGAARAAVVALARRSRRVLVAARRPGRAEALVRELRPKLSGHLQAIDLRHVCTGSPDAGAWLGRADIVVNATSVGMRGEPFLPFAFSATPRECFFYDLIYTVRQTPFVAAAARARRPAKHGLGMLLHQGAAAFEIWTRVKPPLDVMRRALVRSA